MRRPPAFPVKDKGSIGLSVLAGETSRRPGRVTSQPWNAIGS